MICYRSRHKVRGQEEHWGWATILGVLAAGAMAVTGTEATGTVLPAGNASVVDAEPARVAFLASVDPQSDSLTVGLIALSPPSIRPNLLNKLRRKALDVVVQARSDMDGWPRTERDTLVFLDSFGRQPSAEQLATSEWENVRRLAMDGLTVRAQADSLLTEFRLSGYRPRDKQRVLDITWTNYQAFRRGRPFPHGILGGGRYNEHAATLSIPDASWGWFWLVRYERSARMGTFLFFSADGQVDGYCGYSTSTQAERWANLTVQADCCSLRVRLYEDHSGAGVEPRLVLQLRTRRAYGGQYPRIRTAVQRNGNTIDVEDLGMVWPRSSIVTGGFSNAFSIDHLDLPLGQYQLRVKCLDSTDLYSLAITDDAVVVSPTDVRCTEADPRPYWRHPRNSFALYCKALTADRWMCEELVRRVRNRLELQEFSFPDSGTACYSRGGYMGSKFLAAHFFKYPSEEEFQKLDPLLSEFVTEVGARWPSVELWATDWKRRGFSNRDYRR